MATRASRAPRAERELLIVFTDLTRFTALAARLDDGALAKLVDQLYERLHAAVSGAGGQVVKFIGDAMLAVFEPSKADAAVAALLREKRAVDAWFQSRKIDCRLHVKVHLGKVIAGPFGGRGEKRFDVIGKEVNACARLPNPGFSLSAPAFRALSAKGQAAFKQRAPVVYFLD
ncbi:MAG TPA: adenylate/guanylate cyclase domain-containing protein [Myxococcaceae bacterium]|nr:adenylate/guanylate cyclase domain-containing protein [Myxococcaceae bacterium]